MVPLPDWLAGLADEGGLLTGARVYHTGTGHSLAAFELHPRSES